MDIWMEMGLKNILFFRVNERQKQVFFFPIKWSAVSYSHHFRGEVKASSSVSATCKGNLNE